MRKTFAGILWGCHTAVAGLNSCCSRFDDDGRFSAALVIALGILSSLMMAFITPEPISPILIRMKERAASGSSRRSKQAFSA
jgi:hypothetical protein